MPIAENGFTGVALGAALNGLRPVVEIMFGDFCLMAADQIVNGVGKVRHMFGGGFPGADRHAGAHLAACRLWLAAFGRSLRPVPLSPGWRIVAPTPPSTISA